MKRIFGVFLLASTSLVSGGDNKKADAATEELKKLEGTWLRVSLEFEGRKEDVDVKDARMVIKGEVVTFFIGDKLFGEAAFSIDPTKKPRTIDSVAIRPNKGLRTRGIYEIVGDTLRTCMTTGEQRPTEFTTKEESGYVLSIYRRAKN